MRHSTLTVAEREQGMMQVRLSRDAMSVEYRIVRQDGRPILGPCANEDDLERLCYKCLRTKRQAEALAVLHDDLRRDLLTMEALAVL